MTEETLTTAYRGNNTLGLVALILAIVGLLLTISIIGIIFGIPLLLLAFILGIIALFKSPKGKARGSVIISGVVLGGIAYFAVVIGRIIIQPTVGFTMWMQDEIKHNPTMETVFKQPGFESFLENRIKTTMKITDWESIVAEGSFKERVTNATTYTFTTLKEEIPASVDAWIAQYGLPADISTTEKPIVVGPFPNTSRLLREVNGESVNGTYELTFDSTNLLSITFCNTIGGTYRLEKNAIYGEFVQTEMLCMDEEKNSLEAAFKLNGASFSIASTRTARDNLERLAITTPDQNTFLFALKQPEQNTDTTEGTTPPTTNLVGNDRDEHGCIGSAGYSRNEEAQECQRPREQETASTETKTIQEIEALLNE